MKQLIIFIFILFLSINMFSKELAVTIDDMPLVHQSLHTKTKQIEIFKKILKVLQRHKVSALGFVNGNKIKKPYHGELLDHFLKDGHILGNHTYHHSDLNIVTVEDFIEDIISGERAVKKWMKVKYFRYPCLHRGDDPGKQKNVNHFLIKNGYTIVPVTIDNDDYLYNAKCKRTLKKVNPETLKQIGEEYLEHMKERTQFFEKMAQKKIGREVKHILLIHLNYLNSLFLDQLLTWYQQEGWEFITVSEALRDEIYTMEDQYIGKKGISWLERINLKN